MHNSEKREYALGTHDEEIVRLGIQHQLWGASAFAIWERAGIGAGKTVLDLGCGPGYTSMDLAGIVTARGKVIAIDESPRFIEQLKRRLQHEPDIPIDARVGDVQQLDIPEESIDAAYQRWVLCFVKDPEAVIRGVARALRRGGVFAIQEYMHYEGVLLSPASKAFRRFMDVVANAWHEHGGDTQVGLRLPAMLAAHGLTPVEIRPLHRIARSGSPFWTWPSVFIKSYAPKLVDQGRLTTEEHEALVRDWTERSADPTAFFCSPPMVEILAVKQ